MDSVTLAHALRCKQRLVDKGNRKILELPKQEKKMNEMYKEYRFLGQNPQTISVLYGAILVIFAVFIPRKHMLWLPVI